MEIYKGASAFAGIAIGKIQFYRKGEYQLRQHQADDIKTEQRNFDIARRHVNMIVQESQKLLNIRYLSRLSFLAPAASFGRYRA